MQVNTLSRLPMFVAPTVSAAPWSQPVEPVDSLVRSTQDPFQLLSRADRLSLAQALLEHQDSSTKTYYDAAADAKKRDAYYSGIDLDRMSPQQAYAALSDLVERTHTEKLDYNPAKNLYPVVDLHPDGKLHSIYNGTQSDPEALIADDFRRKGELDLKRNEARDRATREGRDPDEADRDAHQGFHYNCEHVVPQSWFDKKSPMRGDLHHLFACDTDCNSTRGNALYTDFPQEVKGECGKLDPARNRFEPAAGKGAVARATLYFMLRYPGQIGDEDGEYGPTDLPTLLQWARENEVTDYERHRNAEIEAKQGNRNPLIDHPEWLDKIDWSQGIGRH